MSADGQFHPNYARGLLNGNQLVRSLLDVKGQGAILTAWARGHSWAPINAPWPLALYAMAQFAASAWSGRTATRDLAGRQAFIAAELGMPARLGPWSLDDVLGMLSRPALGGPYARASTVRRIRDMLKSRPGRGLFGDGLRRILELELDQLELLFLLEEIRWWHPNAAELPPSIPDEMGKRFRAVQTRIRIRRASTRSWYVRWVGEPAAFDNWWEGLFGASESLVAHGLACLRKARRAARRGA